jgi:GNAT superfamily N-acetyltransferase
LSDRSQRVDASAVQLQFMDDVEVYADTVGTFLERDPVRCTVSLTVIDSVRAGDPYDSAPVWSWVEDSGQVIGTALWTPPYHLLLSPMPEQAADAVGLAWRGRGVPGVVGPLPAVDRCAARLADGRETTRTEERLFRLDAVTVPRPPPGQSRLAVDADHQRAAEWFAAFAVEADTVGHDPGGAARRAVDAGRLWLWDDDGPASLVMVRAPVAGVSRLGPVYTPPDRRCRGYARALVADVSQGRLAAGDLACCLFTDLANPVSNSIYPQVGYRPVGDYAEIKLTGSRPADRRLPVM